MIEKVIEAILFVVLLALALLPAVGYVGVTVVISLSLLGLCVLLAVTIASAILGRDVIEGR